MRPMERLSCLLSNLTKTCRLQPSPKKEDKPESPTGQNARLRGPELDFGTHGLKVRTNVGKVSLRNARHANRVRNRSSRDGRFHCVKDRLDVVVALQTLNQRFHLLSLSLAQSLGGGWHPFKT